MKFYRFKINEIEADGEFRNVSLNCGGGEQFNFRVDTKRAQVLLPEESKWRDLDFYLEMLEFVRDAIPGMVNK